MLNLFACDLKRYALSKAYIISAILMLLFAAYNGHYTLEFKGFPEGIGWVYIFCLPIALPAAMCFSREFSGRHLKNKVIAGRSRLEIWAASVLALLVCTLILTALYLLVFIIWAFPATKVIGSESMLKTSASLFTASLGILGIALLVTVFVKRPAAAAAICAAVFLVLTIVTYDTVYRLDAPEELVEYEEIDGEFVEVSRHINPQRAFGVQRAVIEVISKMPIGQLDGIGIELWERYPLRENYTMHPIHPIDILWAAVIFSVEVIIGYAVFKHTDLY